MIISRTLQQGNFLHYYNSTVRIAELHTNECIIQFEDGTLLPVGYDRLSPIFMESNMLLSLECITKISDKKYPLHVKEIYKIDVLGKGYFIHVLEHKDSIICRFDSFISFRYVHELQNICTLVNEEFVLSLFRTVDQ